MDCCFLMSKSRWGQLDSKETGVMYLDLNFHQPSGCRLSQATITMNFHEIRGMRAVRAMVLPASRSELEITEFFGPRTLTGEKRMKNVSTVFEAKPKAEFAGITAEAGGWSRTSEASYASCWKFNGSRFAIHSPQPHLGTRSSKYRQLVWHLEENDMERQSLHQSIVHTALAFHHCSVPFYLDLAIQVKMHRWHHRIKQHLIFPPPGRKAKSRSIIEPCEDIDPAGDFAQLVRNLDHSITQANLHPVEGQSNQRASNRLCGMES